MTKNKAWVQYTKQGKIVPGSLIVSPRRPVNGVWYEVVTDICCDTEPPFGVISGKQKAFVKYDASGNIVPGSLILTDNKLPKPGIWKEVYINICCSSEPSPFNPIVIGDQIWADVNLQVTRFSNGDPIPQATSALELASATGPMWAYAYYDSNYSWMGKMYNMYAIRDPRGLAPTGWHIPTNAEWITLSTTLGPTAGGELKETGTTHWLAPNTGATNSSGFTALPTDLSTTVGGWQNAPGTTGFYIASDSIVDGNDLFGVDYTSDLFGYLTNIGSSFNTTATAVRVIKD